MDRCLGSKVTWTESNLFGHDVANDFTFQRSTTFCSSPDNLQPLRTQSTPQTAMADPNNLPPLPKDHLSNPQNWGTGGEPATEKQKAFIGTLENQHTDLVPPNGIETGSLSKGEASEVIEKLKGGQSLGGENAAEESRQADLGKEEELANAPQGSLSFPYPFEEPPH